MNLTNKVFPLYKEDTRSSIKIKSSTKIKGKRTLSNVQELQLKPVKNCNFLKVLD